MKTMKTHDRELLTSAKQSVAEAWHQLFTAAGSVNKVHLKHPYKNNVTPSTAEIYGRIRAAMILTAAIERDLSDYVGYDIPSVG
jgi:hypothetical protein